MVLLLGSDYSDVGDEPMSVRAFDGRRVLILQEWWRHIKVRHPEVGNDIELISTALSHPDEVYQDNSGRVHSLLRIDEKHFLVVIYEPTNDEGFVRTAYITNAKRKERRYRRLPSLKLS